ncbi:MAG: hypothetical protein EHM20_03245 [Alphaproteobacteria bacterium]|nr:MAG: hypothetical protein EHM20_03245 [Alphaproteobacteria bacterium]
MNLPKITTENWTSSHFHSAQLRAFISLGAAPIENSAEVEIQYLVTLTDKEYQELYQSAHKDLNEAVKLINDKYGHWEFLDALLKTEGDGCSSCAAH